MKLAAIVIVGLIVGIFAVQLLAADPGYVVIDFRGWIIEMSVPALVLLLLAFFLAIWLILKLIRAPRKLGEAAADYRGRRAGKRFTRGLIEIAEGNFAKGERMLTRGARHADTPLLNYLAAARAAQLQNQDERRDNWLKLAYDKQPEASSAILLTQAELQIAHAQYEQAQATLQRLDEQEQGRGQAVVLLGKLFHQLQDWEALGELLPRLRRLGKPAKTTLDEWSVAVYEHTLSKIGASGGDVTSAWREIPKALQKSDRVRVAYVRALIATQADNLAETECRRMLKAKWQHELIILYGEINGDDIAQQLRVAENWLDQRQDDAALLLTAGRLCMANKLWGKARSYIESSLAIDASAAGYSSYGQLLTQLGESGAAADAFRHGLQLISNDTLALPGPTD